VWFVEGFSVLALADQMSLLQRTWLDILCWNFAYRSAAQPGTLVFSHDFKVLVVVNGSYSAAPYSSLDWESTTTTAATAAAAATTTTTATTTTITTGLRPDPLRSLLGLRGSLVCSSTQMCSSKMELCSCKCEFVQ